MLVESYLLPFYHKLYSAFLPLYPSEVVKVSKNNIIRKHVLLKPYTGLDNINIDIMVYESFSFRLNCSSSHNTNTLWNDCNHDNLLPFPRFLSE